MFSSRLSPLYKRNFSNDKYLGYVLLGMTAVFIGTFVFVTLFLPVAPQDHQTVMFHIEKGEGSYEIATNLQEKSFIRSRALFTVYAILTGRILQLQSGDYLLTPSMSASTILNKLASGDIEIEKITIKEGWSLQNIAEEFELRGFFSQDDFFMITGTPGKDYRIEEDTIQPKDFSNEFPFLKVKPEYVSLEGYLFPDTYQITANQIPEEIVRRMLQNFQTHMNQDILEQIQAQEKTLFEVLTMASLIEKEVRSFDDKKIVSGILWKRLTNNMRLQVDATVVYIREGNYKIVSIEETKTDSPYNTYVRDGLPLGPISNPSIESIQAALNPVESPYWFYLSPSANVTIFTRTFEEHKSAKAKYLQ